MGQSEQGKRVPELRGDLELRVATLLRAHHLLPRERSRDRLPHRCRPCHGLRERSHEKIQECQIYLNSLISTNLSYLN